LISFFRKFLSLHFNRFLMIVTTLKLFILILRSFSKVTETTETKRQRLNRLTRIARRSRSRRNVKDLWESADFSFLFVIFDTRKNLSIALFRIKRSFWCLLRTWWNDDIEIDIDDDWNDWSDYLSELDEDSRASKSKRSVSLEESRVNSRENWFEMTDVKAVSEEQYSESRSKFFWYATIKSLWVW
jgi:hypothetical protein